MFEPFILTALAAGIGIAFEAFLESFGVFR